MARKSKKNDLSNVVNKRNDYLIVEANDLAKAFGDLTITEHKILDYFVSFIKKSTTAKDNDLGFHTTFNDLTEVLDLYVGGGKERAMIAKYIKDMSEKTSLTIENGSKMIFTSLLDYAELDKDTNAIDFRFGTKVLPYLIKLKGNYYTTRLSMLSKIEKKHGLTLYKIYLAHSYKGTISGTLEDWQHWFLGYRDELMESKIFRRDVLNKATKELKEKFGIKIEFENIKNGRFIAGYRAVFPAVKEYEQEDFLGEKIENPTMDEVRDYDETLFYLQAAGVSWAFNKHYYDPDFPYKIKNFKKKKSEQAKKKAEFGEFNLGDGKVQTAFDDLGGSL